MQFNILIEKWQSFSLARKVGVSIATVVVIFIGIIVLSFVFTISRSQMGMGSGSIRMGGSAPLSSSMVMGGANYNKMSAPSMMGYDSSSESYYPSTPAVTNKAEDYELTSYQATIESRKIKEDCQMIQNLKADESIIFISSNMSKSSCSFTFKTEKSKEKEALLVIKSLDPRDLNENIHTIEDTLTSYTKRREILENQLKMTEDILQDAVTAYEELSKIAITTGSVTNLRQAIYDKIDIIERLTQKKLTIEQQLRQTGDSIDSNTKEITYTQFSVSVYKDTFVDKDALISSWKNEVKRFVNQMNNSLQDLSIGLLLFIVSAIKYIVYLLLLVVTLKYLKKVIVFIWNR